MVKTHRKMSARRPHIARSRSTPRLASSGASAASKPRVDNTFSCDHGPHSKTQLRHCYSYVQELGRLRQFTEFEASNQKRLMRRQTLEASEEKFTPKYSQGGNVYTARPPTGVDLALGLSGYAKYGVEDAFDANRTPTTLQPLNDEDEERKRRIHSLENQEAKWQQMRTEVAERRAREKLEHDAYVNEARKKQLDEGCEEAREEVSKQLSKNMVEDWDYQREFKLRQQEGQDLHENIAALKDMKVNQETLDGEAAKARDLQREWHAAREAEMANLKKTRFRENIEDQHDKWTNLDMAARETARIKAEDESLADAKRMVKLRAKESLESQIDLKEHDAKTRQMVERRADAFKNEENEDIQNAHMAFQHEAVRDNAVRRDDFGNFSNEMEATKERVDRHADLVRDRTAYKMTHNDHDQVMEQERARKTNVVQSYNKVYEQIEGHHKEKKGEQAEKRLAQEARLESEKTFRAEQQLAKDRRVREQRAYRDFLFSQMNERKARDDHKKWQEKMYIENRMLSTNDRNDAIHKHVSSINVNDMQSRPKEVTESAKIV